MDASMGTKPVIAERVGEVEKIPNIINTIIHHFNHIDAIVQLLALKKRVNVVQKYFQVNLSIPVGYN